MIRLITYFLLIGAGLVACSSLTYTVHTESVAVTNKIESNTSEMNDLIEPYMDSVNNEMDQVLANTDVDLISIRKPSGKLSNWVADAVFVNQTKNVRLREPAFCLLNHGGIRATINKGPVTRGDIFKVMPFDNEIVWVRMPVEVLPEIAAFIRNRGGDPISAAYIDVDGIHVNGILERTTHVWIITSDYLYEGGDNMDFFKKGSELNRTGKLLRDALIEEAIEQGSLMIDSENRMRF